MDRFVYKSGKIVEATEASVRATTAGLLYGWGVFTTVRIYRKVPFALDRHWERLARHAERARIILPIEYEESRHALTELISANAVEGGRARITLLKGNAGGWRTEQGPESELLIFTASEAKRPQADIALTLSPIRLYSTAPLAGVKRTSMLENLLALEEARGRGFSEAVMLNERGEITSATAANIFWIEGDEIFTPSPATGCVAGVTRGVVFEIAKRLKMHLIEGSFPLQRVMEAREVFLTSTAREIAVVTSYDIKEYNRKHARMTRLISREFQKLTGNARIQPG